VRLVWGLLFSLFFLSACSYSTKSVVTVSSGFSSENAVQLKRTVAALRRHRDGCFSKRSATLLVVGTGQQREYLISNNLKAMDLRLSLEGSGQLRVELNEWSEPNFSAYASRCYQQLLTRLGQDFGAEKLSIVESCKTPPCRK